MQDYMRMFWEEVLPYEEFSIRIATSDIPALPAILDGMTSPDIARLQVLPRPSTAADNCTGSTGCDSCTSPGTAARWKLCVDELE